MDVTLLTSEQIWGDDALNVIKSYGAEVTSTDLAVLSGTLMNGEFFKTLEGDLACYSWSASSNGDGYVRCVNVCGVEVWFSPYQRINAARPALSPSFTSKIQSRIARILKLPNGRSVQVGEYGEYPQTIADDKTDKRLELLFLRKGLSSTGKKYTFDTTGLKDGAESFQGKEHPEYEFEGVRYIRVLGKPADKDSRLSNGERVKEGKVYWVQVQPIEWLIDKGGVWVSKKCLFSGIQFDTKNIYEDDFSKTFMKHYLDTYFSKEMQCERDVFHAVEAEKEVKESTKNQNLVESLNELRHDFGHKAKFVAFDSKTVKVLREKLVNKWQR